MQMQVNLN